MYLTQQTLALIVLNFIGMESFCIFKILLFPFESHHAVMFSVSLWFPLWCRILSYEYVTVIVHLTGGGVLAAVCSPWQWTALSHMFLHLSHSAQHESVSAAYTWNGKCWVCIAIILKLFPKRWIGLSKSMSLLIFICFSTVERSMTKISYLCVWICLFIILVLSSVCFISLKLCY